MGNETQKELQSTPSGNPQRVIMPGNYAYTITGTLNGEFLSIAGNTDWNNGVANTKATVGEGAPLKYNTWVWSWLSHYGFAWMPDGGVENPCNKYAHHVTSHWRGKDKMTFDWSFFGSINDMAIEGSGHGFGSGYRQHQWGRGGGKAFGEYGRPNLVWALGWEGHAGLHFFARFPKGMANPVVESLPEGFVVHRKWYGQDGAYWKTTHDVRFAEGHINKRIVLVGAHLPEKGIMFAPASGPDYDKGKIIKRSY